MRAFLQNSHRMRAKHSFHEYWTLKILGSSGYHILHNYRNQNTSPVIKSPPEPLKKMPVDVPTFLLFQTQMRVEDPACVVFKGSKKLFKERLNCNLLVEVRLQQVYYIFLFLFHSHYEVYNIEMIQTYKYPASKPVVYICK